jgi:hypothetical protein
MPSRRPAVAVLDPASAEEREPGGDVAGTLARPTTGR